MPRTEKQYEEIRESKKALIMKTAYELFANEGYHSTSISKIASTAGISKGLLYNYFESKEALLISLIDHGMDELVESFDRNKDGVLTDEELEYFINHIFDLLKSNVNHWRLFFAIMMQPSVFPLVQSRLMVLYHSIYDTMTNYFRNKGKEKPELEAIMFGAFLDGISFNYTMEPQGFPLDDLKKMIIEKYTKQDN